MAVTVPSSPPDLAMAERVRGQTVEIDDWKRIAEVAHFLWGTTQGVRGSIPIANEFVIDDDTSAILAATTHSRISRPMRGLSADVMMAFENINAGGAGEFQVTVKRIDDDGVRTTIAQASTSIGSTLFITFNWSAALESATVGNARQILEYEFEYIANDAASPPRIRHISYREKVTTNSADFI